LSKPSRFQNHAAGGIALLTATVINSIMNTEPHSHSDASPAVEPTAITVEVLPPAEETATSPPVENFQEKLRRSAEEAKKAAQEAMPKIKDMATKAAYGAAYAASYGTTLLGELAKEILPSSLKEAVKEGAEKAQADSQKKSAPPTPEPTTTA
jgi:hypothetical protein